MAGLNTLRTKGGVVLAIVIGISLLAFLLGDLTNSSGFLLGTNNPTVAIIDGKKVNFNDYYENVDEVTFVQQMLSGSDVQNEQASENIRNQAWEKIISSEAFAPSFYNLGFITNEEEKIDMSGGEFVSPLVASIFANQQTGTFDRDMLKNFVANIDMDPSGKSERFWNYIEGRMDVERAMSKYFSLVQNGIYVTSLEAEYVAALNNENSNIQFAVKSLSEVPDSLIKVSESDLKAYYEKHKSVFKQPESREIEYVVFEALPSEEDYADAKKYITEMAQEFKDAEDLPQFVNMNSSSRFAEVYYKASELSPELAEFAFSASKEDIYGPALKNDMYTLARVVDVKQMPDSLGAKHILLASDANSLADSLVTVLKADKSKFAELSEQYSMDKNANITGGDLGMFNVKDMIPDFTNAIVDATVGDIVKVKTSFGIHIVELTNKGQSNPKVLLAEITYKVDPSNRTQQKVYAEATSFISSVNSEKNDFNKVVTDMGLSKRVARLKEGDRDVTGLPSSVEITRWAFKSKVGDMSSVFSIGESNIVAYVVGSAEHGDQSFANVANTIRPIVVNQKKFEVLSKEIDGLTSLDAVKEKWNSKGGEANDITFGSFYIPEIGVAPRVIGAVSAITKDGISKPIYNLMGGNAVVVMVADKVKSENTTVANEKLVLEANAQAQLQQRVFGSVYNAADVVDNRVLYF